MVDFAVVLVFNGQCVTRYNCSHGFPHRDVLGRRGGLLKKEVCPTVTRKEALGHAINDTASNFREYYEFFDTH